jgi:hypothetical protein
MTAAEKPYQGQLYSMPFTDNNGLDLINNALDTFGDCDDVK